MKKTTTLHLLSLFIMVLFASGCGSSKHFGSRKYTAGNYISHKHKAGKVKVNETVKEDAAMVGEDATAAKTEKTTEVKPEITPSEDSGIAEDKTSMGLAATDASTPQQAVTDTKKESTISKAKKQAAFLREKYAIKRYMINKQDRKCLAYDDGNKSPDPVALVSFILSVVAVAINVIAIAIIIGTSEYIFTLLFIVGMVLGIVGLVLGTQGIRRHRKSGGSTLDLVFSIIGTALGGVAILTAFVFAFYTLLFFLSGV